MAFPQDGVVRDPGAEDYVCQAIELGADVVGGIPWIEYTYYPFVRNNMLEVAFLAAHLMWMTTSQDLEILYDLITTKAATALGIDGYGLEEGNRADLVVLNAASVWEAIWSHEAPCYVIKDGRDITLKA